MAEPSKDRDLNVLTAETASASGVSLSNNIRIKNKLLAPKLNSVNGAQKQLKKVTDKVRIDNIPEAELQALLDEVVQYRGKQDVEKGTPLFQALLRETQESGEESPPAFRPTQNTLSSSSAQHRRRRSRKETSGPFSHPNTGIPPSAQCNTVAGSNRKGGSLQNISSHSQSEWGGVRRRKRHDTSDSGSMLDSPRKREGGSLPCDVARGKAKSDDLTIKPSRVAEDCVINMDGVTSTFESEDRFPEPWNHHLLRSERSNTTSCIEQMEQELDTIPSEETGLTKKLLSKGSKEYGSIPFEEVDSAVSFGALDDHRNGTEETQTFHRRTQREYGMDENGNSFNGQSTFVPQPIQLRTSPPMSFGTTSKTTLRPKKKRGKDETPVLSHNLPGHVGNLEVDQLLEYIESSENKKKGLKHNGTLTKIKKKNSKVLVRRSDSNQADSEDSDANDASSPTAKDEDYVFRPKEEEEFVAATAADFQTVTKRQRRKKRNSLSNSTTGAKTKELFEQSHNMFYNASSPSVMMRPPRPTATAQSGGANVDSKKLVASVPPSEPSDLDSDGGDSVHSLPVQPSAPLFPPAASSFYQENNCQISYADIIRSDANNKSDVSFFAESSQPDNIKCARACAASPSTDPVVPAVANVVPFNRARPTPSGLPLRRAASLPPTSPSVETPPVVIVGSSSSTQVDLDVTFGFELNEQLLALSIQQQPPLGGQQQPANRPTLLPTSPVGVSFSPEPHDSINTTSSSGSASSTPTAVDFASRYRERPELRNPQLSRRSYEIVDFISQAWKRIERKLDEQQQLGVGSNAGLPHQSSIRVYTLE